MEQIYSVSGFWPFPVDMLRHEDAKAATAADQAAIDLLTPDGVYGASKEGCDLRHRYSVDLVRPMPHK